MLRRLAVFHFRFNVRIAMDPSAARQTDRFHHRWLRRRRLSRLVVSTVATLVVARVAVVALVVPEIIHLHQLRFHLELRIQKSLHFHFLAYRHRPLDDRIGRQQHSCCPPAVRVDRNVRILNL